METPTSSEMFAAALRMVARLTVTAGPDRGRVFDLPPGQTVLVGRSSATATRLGDPSVSRVHFEITAELENARLVNKSDYGTFVNHERVETLTLVNGDVIRAGGTDLMFESDGSSEAPTTHPGAGEDPLESLANQVGQSVGRYKLEAVVALGQRGVVFAGREGTGGRAVAVKVFPPALLGEVGSGPVLASAKRAMPLRHPHLAEVFDTFDYNRAAVVVMELIAGESLRQIFLGLGSGPARPDWRSALRLSTELARALSYLHGHGLRHGRITPANVILQQRDHRAVLADPSWLGPAGVVDDLPPPSELAYLPPERTRPGAKADHRGDLYSLGATVYHYLTGRPPFTATHAADLIEQVRVLPPELIGRFRPEVPDEFEAILLRLLAKPPELRYPTAGDLLDDLERIGRPTTFDDTSDVVQQVLKIPPPPKPADFAFLSPPLFPGDVGSMGRYRVLRQMGQGGMGLVFHAIDPALERPVALKVLKPKEAERPDGRKRFLREARAMAAVKSEHVVTVYEVSEAEQLPFIAMELLTGASLESWLNRHRVMNPIGTAKVGRDVAEALAAAHARGLVHRDIKPANLWLESPAEQEWGGGSNDRVIVLDFGLARQLDEPGLTRIGVILGTPEYMAPEQARGSPPDPRSDLYSLGVVLYRLCAGQCPFGTGDTMAVLTAAATVAPPPLAQVAPKTPAALALAIHQLLAKDPVQRPPSARAVAELFRQLSHDLRIGSG